jgi:hypothetical protein
MWPDKHHPGEDARRVQGMSGLRCLLRASDKQLQASPPVGCNSLPSPFEWPVRVELTPTESEQVQMILGENPDAWV